MKTAQRRNYERKARSKDFDPRSAGRREKVKLIKAHGGCLGAKRRRRAQQTAKSPGEP